MIEDKIMRWSSQTYSEKGNRSVAKKEGKETVEVPENTEKKKEKAETVETGDKKKAKSYKIKV